jgi:hypothetical protein
MKIALFISGHPRTFFHTFKSNIDLIKTKIDGCEVDVFYSFWDDVSRIDKINDPWHNYPTDLVDKFDFSIQSISEYLIKSGADKVIGEIESTEKMYSIIESSPFNKNKNLSSQYYKIQRVSDVFFDDSYDFYVRIRPDIVINEFLSKEKILESTGKKILFVNSFFWYNAEYSGGPCNEMIWCSNKNIFPGTNRLYSNQEEIKKVVSDADTFGEFLTGHFFKRLESSKYVEYIEKFNFDFRVYR